MVTKLTNVEGEFMRNLVLVLVGLFVSFQVGATVDSHGLYFFPYETAQEGAYISNNGSDVDVKAFCFQQGIYFDGYSSSAIPGFEMIAKPVMVPAIGYFTRDKDGNLVEQNMVQLNKLADSRLKLVVDWDMFEKWEKAQGYYIHEPEFVVDVTGFDQSTAQGRFEASYYAKLAVAALNYNMAYKVYQYKTLRPDYRMDIKIVGLPDQSEFNMEPAVAVTQYKYSYGSPLAKKYFDELISDEFCKDSKAMIEAIYKDPRIAQ